MVVEVVTGDVARGAEEDEADEDEELEESLLALNQKQKSNP